jgi:hypothetical protein
MPGVLECLAYMFALLFQTFHFLASVGFQAPTLDSNDSQPETGLAAFGQAYLCRRELSTRIFEAG